MERERALSGAGAGRRAGVHGPGGRPVHRALRPVAPADVPGGGHGRGHRRPAGPALCRTQAGLRHWQRRAGADPAGRRPAHATAHPAPRGGTGPVAGQPGRAGHHRRGRGGGGADAGHGRAACGAAGRHRVVHRRRGRVQPARAQRHAAARTPERHGRARVGLQRPDGGAAGDRPDRRAGTGRRWPRPHGHGRTGRAPAGLRAVLRPGWRPGHGGAAAPAADRRRP